MALHHKKYLSRISAFVDGELDEEARDLLKEHLKSCRDCETALEDFRRLKELASRASHFRINPYFLTRIKATLEQPPVLVKDASELVARLFIPLLTLLVLAVILLFSSSGIERGLTADDYLYFRGQKTPIEQQLLSREDPFSKEEVLLLSVSNRSGEEPNGR